eukprot:2127589-Pyramimonas_sp.AAC.1
MPSHLEVRSPVPGEPLEPVGGSAPPRRLCRAGAGHAFSRSISRSRASARTPSCARSCGPDVTGQ